MAPLSYCRTCHAPVYALRDQETDLEVVVDWLPVSYGAHVVRLDTPLPAIEEDGPPRYHRYDLSPSPDGARRRVDRLAGSTWRVRFLVVGRDEPERRLYHQVHSVTCAVWDSRAAIERRYKPSAWRRDQERERGGEREERT
jgi:hypothetical protein